MAAEPGPAKSLWLTDPAAAWTSKGARKASFACAVNCLVDVKRAIVVDVAASPARWTEEVATTAVMIERTQRQLGLLPSRLAADSAHGSGRLVGSLMRHGIEPPRMRSWPLLDRATQTGGVLTRAASTFDRGHVRQIAVTPAFKRSARERHKVEMLSAHLKRILGLRRLRLRSPTGAGDEGLLAAIAQNLRRLARNLAAPPRRALQVEPERVAGPGTAA